MRKPWLSRLNPPQPVILQAPAPDCQEVQGRDVDGEEQAVKPDQDSLAT